MFEITNFSYMNMYNYIVEQELLYYEFMDWCLPCSMMNKTVFKEYIVHKGAKAEQVEALFR